MPTSSVSGLLSTSVYFAAVFLLMTVVMVPVAGLYRGSSSAAAIKLSDGIATQIDDLSPGMKTLVQFGSYPGMAISVDLSGSKVTATVNGYSASQTTEWPLATTKMDAGAQYQLLLSGGVVSIA